MKKDMFNDTVMTTEDPVVIPDECGDSMWDAVLQQERKICGIQPATGNAALLQHLPETATVNDRENKE